MDTNNKRIAKNINRGIMLTKDRIIKLKNKSAITREGADKGSYWKVNQ